MDVAEKEIFERLTANESSIKSLHKRVDKQEELIENIRNIVDEIKYLREDINKLDGKVNEIEETPKKRWESVIAAIIGAVAGGIGTAIISTFIH